PPGQRSGLLTQGAFLSINATDVTSNPVLRGVFVREKLLCQKMPPPPPNVADTPPTGGAALTTRDRYIEHSKNPTCYQCHRLMDPIGFGLENFDAVGSFRATEKSYPVNASGEINNLSVSTIFYNGPVELGRALGSNPDVGACISSQVFRYAMGRASETGDQCTTQKILRDFSNSNRNVLSILKSLVSDGTFIKRTK
ncbi:MAG: DUF1588 domain-containing protein, partial [Bdellovibrionia bacterium]